MARVCTGVTAVGFCEQQSSAAHQLSSGFEARKCQGREGEVLWCNFARVQKYRIQGYAWNTGEERAREDQAVLIAFLGANRAGTTRQERVEQRRRGTKVLLLTLDPGARPR